MLFRNTDGAGAPLFLFQHEKKSRKANALEYGLRPEILETSESALARKRLAVSLRQPGQVSIQERAAHSFLDPTSVGFATPAHAGCAFIG